MVYQLLRQECSCGVDYSQSLAVLVVKDNWSFGAVLEQSSHPLLDGIQTDTGASGIDAQECLSVLHLLIGHEW